MPEPSDPTPGPAEDAAAEAGATRSIEQEVEVAGTPEEVWEAIASGPGITAWFVPTTVEPEVGGVVTQRFGPGDEMTVEGRVQAWDPPRRFAFGGPEGSGLAFEWLVEARDGGSCVVRLVNSGFGWDEEGDAEYHGMDEGWKLFLHNLQLHLELFPGQAATAALPTASTSGSREEAWARLLDGLGVAGPLSEGDRVVATGTSPALAGTVRRPTPGMVSLVLDQPARGTGFLAVEGAGDGVTVSVWSYLYGPEGAAAVARDEAAWQAWLAEQFPPPPH